MKFETVAVSIVSPLLLRPPCAVCIVFVECEKQFSVIFVFVLQTANWFRLGSDRFGYGSAQLQCGPGLYVCVGVCG